MQSDDSSDNGIGEPWAVQESMKGLNNTSGLEMTMPPITAEEFTPVTAPALASFLGVPAADKFGKRNYSVAAGITHE